jgi:hypothetical protein
VTGAVESLPLAVRNPIKAHVAAHRLGAQQQLSRMTVLDVRQLTALRARNRLRQMRALLKFLNRTDHAAADGVPTRDERDRLLAPVRAELEKVAKQVRAARRDRKPITSMKETPMATERCVVLGHPHHASGCVIEGPHEEPPAPASNGVALPGFPLALQSEIPACEGIFFVPNFDQVRRQRVLDLARTVLDYPERDRVALVASLFYRFLMRAARESRA